MHFFELRNIQHFVSYLFPSIVAVLLIAAALAYTHFRVRRSREEEKRTYHKFVDGIEDRNEPFPLVLILIILGVVIWAFFYILAVGLSGVQI